MDKFFNSKADVNFKSEMKGNKWGAIGAIGCVFIITTGVVLYTMVNSNDENSDKEEQ